MIKQTKDSVSVYKLGLEFFNQNGASGVANLKERVGDFELFLDLKLHDIPNTVAGAARAIGFLNPRFLTVHASGGRAMIESAAKELPNTAITAVTVLTSLDNQELKEMGLPEAAEFALSLA
ncbi:MAG: orotidine 5'-phosphate decarboxylase / HUMPS family protein, partial [Candidatus Nanopelagicaceae bacterium]